MPAVCRQWSDRIWWDLVTPRRRRHHGGYTRAPVEIVGIPPFSSLSEEAEYFFRTQHAVAARCVEEPRLGIEVTVKHRLVPGRTALRVFIAADPATGLTLTTIDGEGNRALAFADVHLMEALDTGELIPRVRPGTGDELPWVELYPAP